MRTRVMVVRGNLLKWVRISAFVVLYVVLGRPFQDRSVLIMTHNHGKTWLVGICRESNHSRVS